jgi:hypothetical protein
VGDINALASYIAPDGTIVEIGNFENGIQEGEFISTAYAVNADGTVFAGMGWMSGMHTNAFSWTEDGGFVNLSPSDEYSSRVNTMNVEGTVFYGWTTTEFGSRRPTKWDTGTESFLPTFMDSDDGEVMAVSQNGDYLCGISAGAGAVWNSEEAGTFSGETGMGWMTVYGAISNDGVAVGVERNFFEMVQNGVIWSESLGKITATEFLSMHGVVVPEGYSIDFVNYISPDGSLLAGSAFDPNFNQVSWYVKLGELSTIEGNVTLNGTIGNIEDVVVTTGFISTNPDSEGNYSISLPADTYSLTASLPGYEPMTIDDIVVDENSNVTGIDFTLNQFETVTTVNGLVELISWNGIITEVEISAGAYSTNPDSNGEYELLMPAGDYEITASLPEHFTVTIEEQTYEDGETYTHDFTIFHEMMDVQLSGQVNADGDPVFVNGKVQAGENLSSVWDNGQFSHYLRFGNYDVICYVPGYQMQSQNIDVTFDDFYTGLEMTFDLERNYYPAKNLAYNDGTISWEAPFAPTAISEDFNSFDENSHIGSIHPLWTPVYETNGSAIDPVIVENPQVTDDKVMHVSGSNDVVMRLFDLTSGTHNIDFDIMIPEGNAAHFDLLHSLYSITMGIEVFFRANGTMEVLVAGQQHDFDFNHGEFMHISNKVNLDTNECQFTVNGETLVNYDWNIDSFSGATVEWAPLAYLNISADPRPESGENADFYIDNVDYYTANDYTTDAVYNIYLDNLNTPVAENVDLNEYTFDGLVDGETYTAGIEAVYGDISSEMIVTTFTVTEPFVANPPSNLAVDEATGEFTWNAPGAGSGELTEGFEAAVPPAEWTANVTNSAATWHQEGIVSFSDGDIVPQEGEFQAAVGWDYAAQDEWLITPEFEAGANLHFWSYTGAMGSTYLDHYYVKVSTDGGNSWEILWDAVTDSQVASDWEDVNIDLSAYSGNIKLAWQAVDGDGQGLWFWWMIDDIAVTSANGRVISFDGELKTRSNAVASVTTTEARYSRSGDVAATVSTRDLTGYKVFLDGEEVATVTETNYTFTGLVDGTTYTAGVKAVYDNGSSDMVTATFTYTPVDGENNGIVAATALNGNYPNPFNPTTKISFSLNEAGHVTLDVYNAKGQKIKTLVNSKMEADNHVVTWNGDDNNGNKCASGIYFYKMHTRSYTDTRKMLLMK